MKILELTNLLGINGHKVSGLLKKNLPKNLVWFIKKEDTIDNLKSGI